MLALLAPGGLTCKTQAREKPTLREALPTADVQDAILEFLDVAYKNLSEKRKLDAARNARR